MRRRAVLGRPAGGALRWDKQSCVEQQMHVPPACGSTRSAGSSAAALAAGGAGAHKHVQLRGLLAMHLLRADATHALLGPLPADVHGPRFHGRGLGTRRLLSADATHPAHAERTQPWAGSGGSRSRGICCEQMDPASDRYRRMCTDRGSVGEAWARGVCLGQMPCSREPTC